MTSEIRRRATVQPDGYLHIPTPELEPGTEVEVGVETLSQAVDSEHNQTQPPRRTRFARYPH